MGIFTFNSPFMAFLTKAVNYMLQMEDRDREMLRAGNKHMLDYYNEVQKEA